MELARAGRETPGESQVRRAAATDTRSGPDALLLQSPFAGVSGRDALAPAGCREGEPGERRRGLAQPQAKRAWRLPIRALPDAGASRAKLRRPTKGTSSRTPVRGSRLLPRKRSGQTRPPLVVRLDGQVRAAEPRPAVDSDDAQLSSSLVRPIQVWSCLPAQSNRGTVLPVPRIRGVVRWISAAFGATIEHVGDQGGRR